MPTTGRVRANSMPWPATTFFCCGFTYRRGIEIFEEQEPAEYLYQLREGAGRSYTLRAIL